MSLKSKLIDMYRRRPFWREIKRLRENRKDLWKEAVKRFEDEKPVHGSLSEYRKALNKYRVSYDEYMRFFEFWRIDKKQWKEYISEKEMKCIYRKTIQKDVGWCFKNKAQTLETFEKYVHRKWIIVSDVSFDVFSEFVSASDCIVKPQYGTMGLGVMKLKKEDSKDLPQLYQYCRENYMMVEECVTECAELADFHPQSLNTIRVYTISNAGRCELLTVGFRMGRGDNVIDNVSNGGIHVIVDVDTGTALKEGTDKEGNKYKNHPDTNKPIVGFCIPHWNKVVEACKEMTKILPDVVFAGWDICVLPNGEVELIEANSTPNIGILQDPLKVGLKPKLSNIGKEVLGYDPLKLISIWSKSYVK